MTYSPVLIVHIVAGLISVLSGLVALVVRKGSRLHRRAGNVFVISMLGMAAGGAYLALERSQRENVLGGVFTFYLVATAWVTVKRKANETGLAEVGLLLVGLAIGATGWIWGLNATHRSSAVAFCIFGSLALLSAAGDVRLLIRGGVSGTKRLVRHLWRMNFALFVAVGSLFLGRPSDPVLRQIGLRARLFPEALRQTHLPAVPVLFVAVLTIFWLCRVWFTNAYKKPLEGWPLGASSRPRW